MPASLQPVRIDSCALVFTNSDCSCDNCDSATCFTRRRQSHDNCSCFKCHQSKTCLFLTKDDLNFDKSKSDIFVGPNCNERGLFVQCKHIQSSDDVIKNKKELLKIKLSDKSCGKEVAYERVDQMHSPMQIEVMNDIVGDVKITESSVADTVSQPSVKSSKTIVYDDEYSTGKLSAQIMNVPYNDYIKSVNKANSSTKIIKWTTDDILNKIKEAYKACSCKVCECITMIQQPANDPKICNCKPCDCADCRKMRYLNKINNKKTSKHRLCSLCVKKVHKEMEKVKANVKCDCKPCECVQCKAITTKICDCKPCQCADCRTSQINSINSMKRTVIVAPVGEDNTRAVCTCTPCNCMACGRTFGSIATSRTHEMSTGMNRPRNCRCDTCLSDACDQEGSEMCQCNGRERLMRKPVLKDSNDYDIRSALIEHKFNQHKDIAMYAKLSNYSSDTGYNKSNGDCNCNVCQCIVCKDRLSLNSPALLAQREFVRPMKYTVPKVIKLACKCSPCECEICHTKDRLHGRDCKCKVCQCLKCAYSTIRPYRTDSNPAEICKCKPCECIDCNEQMVSCIGDNLTCKSEDRRCVRCKNKNILQNDNVGHFQKGQILEVMADTSQSQRFGGKISQYCESNNNESKSLDRDHLHLGFYKDGYDRENEILESCHTNPTTGIASYINQNNGIVSTSELIEETKSVVQLKSFPSERMLRLSSANGVGTKTNKIDPKKQLSGQSSCNSSGHDYSDYLIKFPRSAVQTCINDVLKLNLDKKLDFTRLNVDSIGNSDNDYTRSPQYSIYCNKIKIPAGGYQENFGTNRHSIAKPMPCNDWNLAKDCKCNPCSCDKCSFSQVKVKRCNCDCMACDCIGSCISDNKSFSIRKNEGTQTKQKVFKDRGQESSKTNSSIFEKDFVRLNTQLYPLLAQVETEINCENISAERNNLKTYDNFIESPPKCTGDVNVYNMPIHINYNSVQSTIREAREFSVQLLQILEKYEKANREFETISQKIQFSQEIIFDNSITPVRNIPSLKTIAEKENDSQDHQLCDTLAKLSSVETKPNPISKYDRECEPDINKNISEKVFESLHEIPTKDMSKSFTENERTYEEMKNAIEQEKKGIESLSSYIFDEVCKKIFDDAKKFEFRDRYKKYRKLIKRAVSISRRFQINSKVDLVATKSAEVECMGGVDDAEIRDNISTAHEFKDKEIHSIESVNDENKRNEESIQSIQSNTQLNIEKNNQAIEMTCKNDLTENEIIKTQISICDIMQRSDTIVNIRQNYEAKIEPIENELPSTIDVKPPDENNNSYASEKYSLVSEYDKEKLCPLEADVKNAIQSISRQMSGDNNPLRPYLGNQALEKLHSEVQKLLNMPQLQIEGTTYYFSEPAPSVRTEQKNSADTKESSLGFNKKCVEEVAHCSYKNPTYSYKNNRRQQPKPFASIPNFYQTQQVDSRTSHYGNLVSTTPSPSISNNDALKISFYGVRRVSDHTILVKWNPPRDMKDVQGYELLVDGHAVQKILSPTRCMAVVTCLPHSERVLLTVRTLTAHTPPAHCPATTFVYRPRVK